MCDWHNGHIEVAELNFYQLELEIFEPSFVSVVYTGRKLWRKGKEQRRNLQ